MIEFRDPPPAPPRALRGVAMGATILFAAVAWGGAPAPGVVESVLTAHVNAAGQYAAINRGLQEFLVTFEFEQTVPTTDQITTMFTNVPADFKILPSPVFGTEIVQEFSFSGRDFPTGTVRFSRRVRDRSFLDCRYIRVVNHGSSKWSPTTISLSVNGQRILDNVSMFPRKGADPKGGLEGWTRDRTPVFWEGELQRSKARS
ncbi:MAG TPA: hypothetical protein VH458_00855 [Vicinamibacterales bacterium]|jgi:hypothetical protein